MELQADTYVDAEGNLTEDPAEGIVFVGPAGRNVKDEKVAELRNGVLGGAFGLRKPVPGGELVQAEAEAEVKRRKFPFSDKGRKAKPKGKGDK